MQKKNIFIRLSGIALIGALLLVCIINQIKIESLMIAILTIILFLACSIFSCIGYFLRWKKERKGIYLFYVFTNVCWILSIGFRVHTYISIYSIL